MPTLNLKFSQYQLTISADRSTKPKSSAQPIRHFLNLPTEIRLLIYEFFFSSGAIPPLKPNKTKITKAKIAKAFKQIQQGPASIYSALIDPPLPRPRPRPRPRPLPPVQRTTAISKSNLLLTNRLINSEARPLLYRHHTFHFECGFWRLGELDYDLRFGTIRPQHQPLSWMTKVELTNHARYFPLSNHDVSVYTQLSILDKYCPKLKSLGFNVHVNGSDRDSPTEDLDALWARLDELEVRLQVDRPSRWVVEWCLGPIAPRRRWSLVDEEWIEGYAIKRQNGRAEEVEDHMWQMTWVLDCSKA